MVAALKNRKIKGFIMKKQALSVLVLMVAAILTGCQSPGRNPAGVYGGAAGEYGTAGSIPLAGRFTGGTEHPGLFAPVLFGYDSSQVSASERPKIEAVSQHLLQNPSVAVIIEGHCDERGSCEYNLALGERRALAVRSYLTGLGISSDRIQTKSLGEEAPAAPGHDESAWSLNRRGEFVLYY
jgi:peptidoglycan-associated lipoprotein